MGAVLGKGVDVVVMDKPSDQVGSCQAAGGFINDVGTFVVGGGNGGSWGNMVDAFDKGKKVKSAYYVGEASFNTFSFIQSGVSNLQTFGKK